MRFIILDGSGFLYRAYHGLPLLTDSEGRPVQAVYGCIRMICNILMTRPDYICVVWDAPVKTLRHIAFSEYKANRPSTPDELRRQITTTKDIVGQLGIPFLEIPGYEADDIIATLVTTHARDEGILLEIASGDKDLKQMLRPGVVCTDPMKHETVNHLQFVQQFGFEPVLMVDYLALIGDSSDNIPGVAGIGPKGATDLIKTYGTIQSIYEHISDISPALQDKLLLNKENAFKSKDLIVLMDVPGVDTIKLDQFICEPDFDVWREILMQRCGFHSMTKLLDQLRKQLIMPVQESLF